MANTFSRGELILIKYADGFCIGNQFPNYFVTLHKIDTADTIKKALKKGLIEITPLAETICKYTIPEIKDFIASKETVPKGNKAALAEYIVNHFSEEEINGYFTKRYYRLTAPGKEYLEEHLSTVEYYDRFEPILKGFEDAYAFVKKGQYSAAEGSLEKHGCEIVELPHKYQTYDDFLNYPIEAPAGMDMLDYKAYVILYYMYGVRTESAVKDFKKRTGCVVDYGQMHKHMRLIKAIDDLIGANAVVANKKASFTLEYSITTSKDERVCLYCQSMEGKVFSPDRAVIGKDYPPFDKCVCDYCRCFASTKMVERKKGLLSFFEKLKK